MPVAKKARVLDDRQLASLEGDLENDRTPIPRVRDPDRLRNGGVNLELQRRTVRPEAYPHLCQLVTSTKAIGRSLNLCVLNRL